MFAKIWARDEFTGWHMAGVMGLFFGVIIGVNLTLAVFAGSTWTGLVVKNSYVASQQFNAETERMKREAELGWSVHAAYRNEDFSLDLKDGSGRVIQDALVSARIGRPVSEHEDRTIGLNQMRDGLYHGDTDLGPGLWEAQVSVEDAHGQTWNRRLRFSVSAAGEIVNK